MCANILCPASDGELIDGLDSCMGRLQMRTPKIAWFFDHDLVRYRKHPFDAALPA